MAIKRQTNGKVIAKVDVCGVKIDDISLTDAVREILLLALSGKRAYQVVTVNSEFVMLARRDPNFAKILDNADLALADGMFVVISKLIFGGKVQVRITGVDLINEVSKQGAKKAIRIGFLGGFGGVADRLSKRQKKYNPGIKIVLAKPGDPAIGYDLKLRGEISAVGRIDILFVAYGMGQQEFWIERNRKYLDVGVFIGVGGAFDYIAGVKRRAPVFMQNIGMEWLWRLIYEPSRVWRMRVLPAFFFLVVFMWFSKKFTFLKIKNF